MTWVDSHVHLQADVFRADLPGLLALARTQGVSRWVCNGTRPADWPVVWQLAREHADVIPCFGLHPWYVTPHGTKDLASLIFFLDQMPSAMGEIGLDRWIEPRDEALQEAVFRAQLELARDRQLPVMIHCVRAWGWLLDVLRSIPPLPAGFLLHAYGGAADLVKPLAEMGAYFSVGGGVLAEHSSRRRESLSHVPPDRLLLETDAPDILPPPAFRAFTMRDADGRERNHPANLGSMAAGVARLLNRTPEALARQTTENARRFLGRAWR